MSHEPYWHRHRRLEREAAEEARYAAKAAAVLGVDELLPTEHADCPTCGADAQGRWAYLVSRGERAPFCAGCVPWILREQLADACRERSHT